MANGKAVPALQSTQDRNWQAEDDHRVMLRAGEIKADKVRMAGVRRHNRKQISAMMSISRSLGKR